MTIDNETIIRKKERKIGITTYYRFNYGSILQCYATCRVLEQIGYQTVVLDILPSKIKFLADMVLRCLCHPKHIREFYNLWKASRASRLGSIPSTSLEAMDKFVADYIPVKYETIAGLKSIGNDSVFVAFLSGSDQIWNGHSFRILPHYFLRFAPKNKRIAWAPSFGTSDIAQYNWRIYKKYISQYAALSVRENDGVKIIEELIGKKAIHLIDPVFLLTGEAWASLIKQNVYGKYVLCYFLDDPHNKTIDMISEYSKSNKTTIIVFGNISKKYEQIEGCKIVTGGPKEFLSLISSASCLFTDSFHGVSFSIIMHVPFRAFRRNYTHGVDQSSRLYSILKLCQMESAFEPNSITNMKLNFKYADRVIEEERRKMINYLIESIEKTK